PCSADGTATGRSWESRPLSATPWGPGSVSWIPGPFFCARRPALCAISWLGALGEPRTMARPLMLLLLLLGSVLAGASDSAAQPPDAARAPTVHSATPVWTANMAWRVALMPDLSLGGSAAPLTEQFDGTWAARRLRDGRILVGDRS